MAKPILCLDFDGTIHSYQSGWKSATNIPDPPIDGAFNAINDYLQHFDVQIYSSRSNYEGAIDAMKKWFNDWGFENTSKLKFPLKKPPAFLTLDDKAMTFTGNYPTSQELLSFKPWNLVEKTKELVKRLKNYVPDEK